MSIVFLPMMKNSTDKITRFEQAINLSKEIPIVDEQVQIQAMLQLLAEKFIKDSEILQKLKELINMGIIAEMIRQDHAIAIAKKMLIRDLPVEVISETTGLDEQTILNLQAELKAS